MRDLYLLFDETCGLCVSCWSWLIRQPAYVHIECIPSGGTKAKELFPTLAGSRQQLIAIDDRGGVYRGTQAWLMCLWALTEWRSWAMRFSSPLLMPFAREAFELVSGNRKRISKWLKLQSDNELALYLATVRANPVPQRCEVAP
ncbi:MAG: DUF393 domain-containing protein [Myxococcaceae bacterium]|nr:DUF393 domain-containing protein [Myxococcaceae bacterium]